MSLIVDLASWVLILGGSFFTVVGAIGLLRMPDVLTRLHAGSLIDSLGISLLVAGMVLQAGFSPVALKLLLLAAAVFFTWPVVTHALAQVCLHENIHMELAEDRREMARARLEQTDREKGRRPSN